MPKWNKEKNIRAAIYVDCVLGIISSIISLTGIFYSAIITNTTGDFWVIGLSFWTAYLLVSIYLIFLGIYTYFREKKYGVKKPKKDLKPPIVS